jgi:hypothetical protein
VPDGHRTHNIVIHSHATEQKGREKRLQEAIARFLTSREVERLTAMSLGFYKWRLRHLHFRTVEEITPDALRAFLHNYKETHSPAGLAAEYRAVRALLRFVEAEEQVPGWVSPTHRVRAPRVDVPPIRAVTSQHVLAMAAVSDIRVCVNKSARPNRRACLCSGCVGCAWQATPCYSCAKSDLAADSSKSVTLAPAWTSYLVSKQMVSLRTSGLCHGRRSSTLISASCGIGSVMFPCSLSLQPSSLSHHQTQPPRGYPR